MHVTINRNARQWNIMAEKSNNKRELHESCSKCGRYITLYAFCVLFVDFRTRKLYESTNNNKQLRIYITHVCILANVRYSIQLNILVSKSFTVVVLFWYQLQSFDNFESWPSFSYTTIAFYRWYFDMAVKIGEENRWH